MPPITPPPQDPALLVEAIITRLPEGLVRRRKLARPLRLLLGSRVDVDALPLTDRVGSINGLIFDAERLTPQQAEAHSQWARPSLPDDLRALLEAPTVVQQRDVRARALGTRHIYADLLARLAGHGGCAPRSKLIQSRHDEAALEDLLGIGTLAQQEHVVYDPLALGPDSVHHLTERARAKAEHHEVVQLLRAQPGQTVKKDALIARYGAARLAQWVAQGTLTSFQVALPPHTITWMMLADADLKAAQDAADAALRAVHEGWQVLLSEAGELLRPGTQDGHSARERVLARSYTVKEAARRLALRQATLEEAIEGGVLPSFTDPEGVLRVPADEVEAAYADVQYQELIAEGEVIKPRDIALVLGVPTGVVRSRLRALKIDNYEPRWGAVRGQWGLPDTLLAFRVHVRDQRDTREERRETQRQSERQALIDARNARNTLKNKLIAAFPTWEHPGRADQVLTVHVGPTNSGKTHHALTALEEAGSGWYLAPLRLLAFEVFERLNARGVACNLLTGEEFIPVEGARITAATVEMFNPQRSGACVVIDEVHMLADPDRGWAWTRALMEAEAPDVHALGPVAARGLLHKLADGAALPVADVEHERLTPLAVADQPWTLRSLPPRTILVAFSRKMVLELKTELERLGRRVSIVYGSLPPEVRRRQADRFAVGDTEVCIATDAVGMGLNLPADNVCFYEVEKFDGQGVRTLTAGELQQIGGRAGRFGYSQAGLVGALDKKDLQVVRNLFRTTPPPLTYAHVAPSVDDLAMLPGNLAERLELWGQLRSIPDALRGTVRTADMQERISLAQMLADREVEQLGLTSAVKLINAPTRQSTRAYWRRCVSALVAQQPMPLPDQAPASIVNTAELERTEACIASADVYLWLSQREDFAPCAPDEPHVRAARTEWSTRIDEALLKRLRTVKACSQCGRALPANTPYGLCNTCFRGRRA